MIREDGGTHRLCFNSESQRQPKRGDDPRWVGSLSLPFSDTVKFIFESDTGIEIPPPKFPPKQFKSIKTENEFIIIEQWVSKQGSRVFLRDCLDLSIALDHNFATSEGYNYTTLGNLESRAKNERREPAITSITDQLVAAIRDLPGYRDATHVTAVPCDASKTYDLPRELAARVAAELGLPDITPHFKFERLKEKIKEKTLDQKWDTWERAGVSIDIDLDRKSNVIIIDDKYQSGISAQFVGAKLQAAGAMRVYGLYVVKTLRDSDNS